jgi:hypothetical protein
MNSAIKREKQNFPRSNEVSQAIRPNPIDLLLALDRMVVEVSMQLYNVDQGDRSRMRRQNRRLHAAVRRQFPRI